MMEKFPAKEILDFWFGDSCRNPEALQAESRRWFSGGEVVDREVRQRFGDWIHPVGQAAPEDFATPQELLAGVLVLDQFARQVYRGTAEAFAFDDRALALLDLALVRGWDRRLHPLERSFLYMPLQHVEDLPRQREGVALFEALSQTAPVPYREFLRTNVDFARQHLKLIERFGRFPHRNRALGRRSSDEETAYLSGGGARFGQ